MESTERYAAMRRVTWIGALVNIVLAVAKVVCGWISHSHGLIADGLHSFSDLATDALVLFAARHSNQDADQEHPYGHARFETASTVGLGVVLIAVAIGIIIDAGQRLLHPTELEIPTALAWIVAALSIVAKEILFRYTLVIGREVNSPLLRANAWHHRSDAVSSVVVLIGVLGSIMGFTYLDVFAAVAVALMIAKIGWQQGWSALEELVDRGVDPERLRQIELAIADVEGVHDLHTLRTRRMGGEVLVDVHVQVDPYLSVSEGHQIGEFVRRELLHSFDDVTDVTVHIDPEDDESTERCAGLPLRRVILRRLRERWSPIVSADALRGVNLHYLSGHIDIDVIVALDEAQTIAQSHALAERLREAIADMPEIGSLRLFVQ